MLLSGIIALVPPINAKEVNCLVKGALYIDNTPAAEGQADVQLFFTTPDEMFHSVTFAWDDGYNYNIQIANGNHYRSVGDIGTFIVHVGYNYLKPYDNRTFTVFEINLTNSYLTHMNLHVNRNDTLPPNKPILIAPSPSGTTISSTNSATLQVLVTDPDGDEMDVSFYNANGNVLLGKVMDVTNGSTVNYTWSPLSSSTTYSWYVIVSDSIKQNTSDTWSFTTATPSSPPPPYTPPATKLNHSIDLLPSLLPSS